jgi:hypothetical protein
MTAFILRHRVGDFGTWFHAHEERAEMIGQVSSSLRMFQDVDDPNSVVMMIETDELGKLEVVMNGPGFKELSASTTVIDPIIVSVEVGA